MKNLFSQATHALLIFCLLAIQGGPVEFGHRLCPKINESFAAEALALAAVLERAPMSPGNPSSKGKGARVSRRNLLSMLAAFYPATLARLRGEEESSEKSNNDFVKPARVFLSTAFNPYEREMNDTAIWLAGQFLSGFQTAIEDPQFRLVLAKTRDLKAEKEKHLARMSPEQRSMDTAEATVVKRKNLLFVGQKTADGHIFGTLHMNPGDYQDIPLGLGTVLMGLAEAMEFYKRREDVRAGAPTPSDARVKTQSHRILIKMLEEVRRSLTVRDGELFGRKGRSGLKGELAHLPEENKKVLLKWLTIERGRDLQVIQLCPLDQFIFLEKRRLSEWEKELRREKSPPNERPVAFRTRTSA